MHSNAPDHRPLFREKMESEGLQSIVIKTFLRYYEKVVTGETGMIPEAEIEPLTNDDIPAYEILTTYGQRGDAARGKSVRIILNGGLGTSMGLKGPKSLLKVKNDKSFIEILVRQSEKTGIPLVLMNSFSTHDDTRLALERIGPNRMPSTFLQHKFPKILQEDLTPARWPADPELEWNPPGHGDIYAALATSGMLDTLLEKGIEFAFISNSDNLGASMDFALLGYFAEKNFPFMMEVAERTPADMKGGHLARHKDGYLLLRESAQCPDDAKDDFQDITKYRFFNTNNLWVNLRYLKSLIEKESAIDLPMILNPKNLDPRDDASPRVYQVESAMGAAISLFEGSAAVRVPRTRFFPVKKCNDLLILRSDYVRYSDESGVTLNPERATDHIAVNLDPDFYGKIDDFDQRFPAGPPSLVRCESLSVKGDILFQAGVTVKGEAEVVNSGGAQAVVTAGSVVEGDVTF